MIINIKLDINAVNTIIAVLKEVAYKISEPIISELNRQAVEQMKPQAVPDMVEAKIE